jgi:type VI secretion system ImpJ/VasE family protein
MTEQVHWHEGLFLQPHHLQTMQRQGMERAAAERRLRFAYPYGVVEAKLSPDAMENHVVRFDRLRVVMPSGVEIAVPENAELPPLDIKQAFESSAGSFNVYLALPLWYATRGNSMEIGGNADWRVRRMFQVTEVTRTDENTGENAQPLIVRRLNARLIFDGDDRTDLEVIPLLRISHATGVDVGLPRQDPRFIPPCLLIPGSTVLRDLVRDLAQQVEASRKELAQQIARAGFNLETIRGIQFEQMLRLRTLNRFSGRLPHIAEAPGTTPFEMYLELRELLGELSALNPTKDDFDVPAYDHDEPAVSFFELDARIRPYLKGAVKQTWISVPFAREGPFFVANLTDEHLTQPNDYFLGVKTRQEPRAVATLVEDADKFKLMAKRMVRQAVWGVKLNEERQPPLELPAQGGLMYFRLNRAGSKMWEQAKLDKGLAITIRGTEIDTSDFNITLYMTVPGGGGGAASVPMGGRS